MPPSRRRAPARPVAALRWSRPRSRRLPPRPPRRPRRLRSRSPRCRPRPRIRLPRSRRSARPSAASPRSQARSRRRSSSRAQPRRRAPRAWKARRAAPAMSWPTSRTSTGRRPRAAPRRSGCSLRRISSPKRAASSSRKSTSSSRPSARPRPTLPATAIPRLPILRRARCLLDIKKFGRWPMRLWLAALISLVSLLWAPMALAQDAVPTIAYDSVSNLLKLPDDMHLGEVAGVAVNSKGHIFVYARGGSSAGPAYGNTASQLLEFAPNGKFVREIGKNLYAWAFAHTVRIDKDDNICDTDKGSDMVIKFNPQGRVVMVFGRKSEASDAEAKPHERNLEKPLPHVDGRFRQPTDVTWGPDGTIYISDRSE